MKRKTELKQDNKKEFRDLKAFFAGALDFEWIFLWLEININNPFEYKRKKDLESRAWSSFEFDETTIELFCVLSKSRAIKTN